MPKQSKEMFPLCRVLRALMAVPNALMTVEMHSMVARLDKTISDFCSANGIGPEQLWGEYDVYKTTNPNVF